MNVYVKNDWKEHILHDQHRTVDNFSHSLVKGEDQLTVSRDRKVEILGNDHLTVRGDSHTHIRGKWLVRAGREIHFSTGRKTVIEPDTELTSKADGGFIKRIQARSVRQIATSTRRPETSSLPRPTRN